MRKKKTGLPHHLAATGPLETSEEPTKCVVECAFCHGQGKDPFELLSCLATCQVCGGQRLHTLELPVAVCAYCSGSGVHPHSRMTCTSCKGVGKVHVDQNSIECPACGGTGRASNYQWPDSPLSCNFCRGVGRVSVNRAKLFEGQKS